MQPGINLIVGLGNPGAEYERTRHNAGFWLLDELAHSLGQEFRAEARFKAWTAKCSIAGRECWLLKPANFMNRSGFGVAALAGFFKIAPTAILVVHDELDLPAGTVRIKQCGGHGGHNGLRDIIAQLGADFMRMRIGIGHPGKGNDVVTYVLNRPRQDEEVLIHDAMASALAELPSLVNGDFEKAMHRLHSRAMPASS